MPKANSSSSERRITVLRGLWPKLQQMAERDEISVADVVNAILLQNLHPYGGCAALAAPPSLASSFNAQRTASPASHSPDPYQVADIDSW